MTKYCFGAKIKISINFFEYGSLGERMLLHDVNNNILISLLSYSVVYQDDYEISELYQDINIFVLEPKQNNLNLQCTLPVQQSRYDNNLLDF